MGGQIDEEGWLRNVHLFAQLRRCEGIMTEYEVKYYEAACEMLEQQARFHKLFFEMSIERAKEQLDNEQNSRDTGSGTRGVS